MPRISESPEKKSKRVQIFVNDFCLFPKQYWLAQLAEVNREIF